MTIDNTMARSVIKVDMTQSRSRFLESKDLNLYFHCANVDILVARDGDIPKM